MISIDLRRAPWSIAATGRGMAGGTACLRLHNLFDAFAFPVAPEHLLHRSPHEQRRDAALARPSIGAGGRPRQGETHGHEHLERSCAAAPAEHADSPATTPPECITDVADRGVPPGSATIMVGLLGCVNVCTRRGLSASSDLWHHLNVMLQTSYPQRNRHTSKMGHQDCRGCSDFSLLIGQLKSEGLTRRRRLHKAAGGLP